MRIKFCLSQSEEHKWVRNQLGYCCTALLIMSRYRSIAANKYDYSTFQDVSIQSHVMLDPNKETLPELDTLVQKHLNWFWAQELDQVLYMTYAISEKGNTHIKISSIPCACLQVAAERLENCYATTNSFHLGPSFLCTQSIPAWMLCREWCSLPARGLGELKFPCECLTKGQLEKFLPFSPVFIPLPLSLYYNLNFILFLSSFTSSSKETRLNRIITALLEQLIQLGRAEQALRCTAPPSGAHSDISPSCLSPQHSTVSSFPSPCFTASSFLSPHSGSPLLHPYLLFPLSAWCDQTGKYRFMYSLHMLLIFSDPSLAVDFSFL